MRKLVLIVLVLVSTAVFSQAPKRINYQGVARDAGNTIIVTAIGIKFEILQGTATGTTSYEETNVVTPSAAGIFTAAIGMGSVVSPGTFPMIDWSTGPYFLRVSIDPAGGTSFSMVGTSELISVPYALYAETSGSSQTVNINQSGIANVLGAYPNYTVDVPNPNLNYNTGTNVLTLTQGTAVATTTLSSSGSNTVSMFASGIASVTPIGAGNNFTVSVQTPSFTGAGTTTVSGTYPNYLISTPPGSTVAALPTNIIVNPPHTTTTLSPGNYSITVQPTNISGTGVTGTYPNYTITPGSSTSVTSGASNVIINGTAPSYTISATTPSLQVNSPHTTTTLSLNSYSLNIAPTNITGAGVASVSGTYPNYVVTVPSPTISSSGNTITITQGTAVATSTFSAGPWAYTGTVLHPAANPTNDKVAIGQNSATSNLDVANNAGSTNTINPVVSINNNNALFTGSGVLSVRNNNGGGAAIYTENNSTGDGVHINMSNPANGGNGIESSHAGSGNAGYFSVTNTVSTAKAIDALTMGGGSAISAVINNTISSGQALYVSTNGAGSAGYFNKLGTGYGVYSSHIGTSGSAGFFNISNASNGAQALTAQTSGNGDALATYQLGSGRAFYATNTSSIETALIGNAANGRALQITNNGNNETVYMSNLGSGPVLYATSNANFDVAQFNNNGTARSVVATNNSASETIFALNSGTGKAFQANNTSSINPTAFFSNAGNNYAMLAQNSSAVLSRAANIVGGLDIMGKTTGSSTYPLVITNIASTNIFNVRDDGHVGINVPNPGYRLSVLESSGSTAAIFASQNSAANSVGAHGIYGLTSNTNTFAAGVMGENNGSGPGLFGIKSSSSGNAGRFEQNLATNSGDAVFVQTNGIGASIHTKNIVAAGSNNLGVLVEDGHIGTLASAIPTGSVSVACTACSAASISAYSNDVAGAFTFNMAGTFGVNFDFTVNYMKPYRKNPVVVITPANIIGGNAGKIYVVNLGGPGNYTGFQVFFIGGVSGGAGMAKFNYMVIEASN